MNTEIGVRINKIIYTIVKYTNCSFINLSGGCKIIRNTHATIRDSIVDEHSLISHILYPKNKKITKTITYIDIETKRSIIF